MTGVWNSQDRRFSGVDDPRVYAPRASSGGGGAQIQRTHLTVNLNTIASGTEFTFFLLWPQDAALQEVRLHSERDAVLIAPLDLRVYESIDGERSYLTEQLHIDRVLSSGTAFTPRKPWSGRGGIYLSVQGSPEPRTVHVTVEYLTNEVI